MTSEKLASYWIMPQPIKRSSKSTYVNMYNDGRSANVVVLMGNLKAQVPKWYLRDLLSLSYVVYPDQSMDRRGIDLKRVEVTPAMKKYLDDAGMQYEPGILYTKLAAADIDPSNTFDKLTRADKMRSDSPTNILKAILHDIKHNGVDVMTDDGLARVMNAYGWTEFEIVCAKSIYELQQRR